MKLSNEFVSALVITVFITTIAYANVVQDYNSFLLYDSNQLKSLKEQNTFSELHEDMGVIIRGANKSLAQTHLSVTQKTVLPPSCDPHDYVSLAIYYWPDPNKPDGLPYINHDGRINPEKDDLNRYDGNRLSTLVNSVDNLSLAYYLTGKEEYAAKATELLKVWFINPDTKMNPSLNYGQAVPGKSLGRPSGIIETTGLIRVVDAAHMLENSTAFTKENQIALKAWFSNYLDWLLTSKLGINESNMTNNHAVWYDAQVATYAHYVGRDDIAVHIVNEAKEKRIQKQIESDGSMPRELARTNSISYTAYNLQAFITLARIGDDVGVNIWDYQSTDGRSIKKAIDYWVPYLLDKKQWEHEQITAFHGAYLARYLYFAKLHYDTDQYDEAIAKLLTKSSKS